MSNQSGLMRSRRFAPLFVTQFLGAFNDNVLKNAMVVLLTFQSTNWTTMKPELLANLAAGVFILPFFLFSATAGQLADKYDKAALARLSKLLEVAIVLIAGAGFFVQSLNVLFLSLFLMGLQSTLFGPVKYAILPQHLKSEELVGGNALIEAGTFVAILLGTLLGGLLAASEAATVWITVVGLAIAVGGYLASRSIPVAVPPAPTPVPPPKPVPIPEPKPLPPPPKPDIAIKEKEKPKPPPPKVAPAPPRVDPFQEQLRREAEQLTQRKQADSAVRELAQMKASQAASSRNKAMADYLARIRGKIRGNIVVPPEVKGNPEACLLYTSDAADE